MVAACAALAQPLAAQTGPAAAPAEVVALQTIPSLDLPRYMGTWHEVAKYPNRFQRSCTGPAQADYSLQPGGSVQVRNRCPQAGGRVDEALGEARRVGGEGSARLQVRFAPAWLGWLPMVWGNYWVIDLDAGYTLAAVSEPQREYLWILSRQPQPDPQAYAALLQRLAARGFDLQRLEPAPG